MGNKGNSVTGKSISRLKQAAIVCLSFLFLVGVSSADSAGGTIGTHIIDGNSITAHQVGAQVILGNSCDYDWWHGCSPTSAGMIMGHYDRNGYGTDPLINQYPNLVPGGVAEANTYGSGTYIANNAIASSEHIADFFSGGYGASGDDVLPPFHNFNCLADFMSTSQDAYDNSNGSTTFWYYTDGSRLHAGDIYDYGASYYDDSGMFGIYEYVNYCGYGSGNPDTNFFNQYIDAKGATYGFTFDEYKAEIDAGRPILIHVEGHSMYGYGYDTGADGLAETIILHDTWNPGQHTMTWGGTYSGLMHYGVTCVTVTNGVPEPATMSLLALGGLGVLIRKRRK